jgi:hypothetical protein
MANNSQTHNNDRALAHKSNIPPHETNGRNHAMLPQAQQNPSQNHFKSFTKLRKYGFQPWKYRSAR